MLRFVRAFGVSLGLLFNLSCSDSNILQSFGNQNTDAALYQSALTSINQSDFNGALTQIGKMSTTYASTQSVIELKASAYGGLCGVQFIPFASNLSNLGSNRILPFLLNQFDQSSSAAVSSCDQAEAALLSLGNASTLSSDDNFFLAVIEMAKVGNILSFYADAPRSGTAATGFDPCAVGATPVNGGSITDSDTGVIGASVNLAIASLTAVSSVISTGGSSFAPITTICTQLPPGYNFCSITNPTAFTSSELLGIRSLIKESTVVGLGSNCTGDVSVCFCP